MSLQTDISVFFPKFSHFAKWTNKRKKLRILARGSWFVPLSPLASLLLRFLRDSESRQKVISGLSVRITTTFGHHFALKKYFKENIAIVSSSVSKKSLRSEQFIGRSATSGRAFPSPSDPIEFFQRNIWPEISAFLSQFPAILKPSFWSLDTPKRIYSRKTWCGKFLTFTILSILKGLKSK